MTRTGTPGPITQTAQRALRLRWTRIEVEWTKWIMNFELDPNIRTGFKSWSKYLDLDLKKIQTSFAKEMDLGWKSNPII